MLKVHHEKRLRIIMEQLGPGHGKILLPNSENPSARLDHKFMILLAVRSLPCIQAGAFLAFIAFLASFLRLAKLHYILRWSSIPYRSIGAVLACIQKAKPGRNQTSTFAAQRSEPRGRRLRSAGRLRPHLQSCRDHGFCDCPDHLDRFEHAGLSPALGQATRISVVPASPSPSAATPTRVGRMTFKQEWSNFNGCISIPALATKR